MAKLKRKHIPIIELLASALADRLPQKDRDALRWQRVPALAIVRMFTPDHIALHAWGGADKWWNLHMARRGADLKKKDAADTSRAAKAARIESKWSAFTAAMAKGRKPKNVKKKSRMQSRGFQKQKEGYRNGFQRHPG